MSPDFLDKLVRFHQASAPVLMGLRGAHGCPHADPRGNAFENGVSRERVIEEINLLWDLSEKASYEVLAVNGQRVVKDTPPSSGEGSR